jgi:ATP-dependent exoDNAse (exonuclease V) beta subunit
MVAGDLNQAFSKKIWDKEDLKDLFLKGTSVSQQLLDKWQALRKVAEKYAEVRALEIPGPYLKLLEPWRNQLTSLKSESRSIFLSDINILARRLLTEFILPEVIFRLGDRLYHFLIDEFQDTSILQWKNLFPLIDNALAQGGSLFCVGDRKQLLYRWRGSDLAVFQDGPKAFKSIEDSGLIDFVLSYNWRSREVLLNFVSRVFEKDNLQRWIKDESSISNVLDPARAGNIFSGALQQVPAPHAVSHKGGIVRLEIIESDGSLEEIREESKLSLLRLLKQDLLMRYSLNDVLILVRDNQEVQEFSHRLISASIPVCSHRQLDIREDALIREILATLCILEMPTDDQAFAALITGDVMSEAWKNDAKGLNPEEWLELQKFRSQGLKAEYLYQRFQADFPHLWAGILQEVFRSVGFLPLYDLVSMLVCKLNLIQRFPDHFLAFSHLMELLHVYEPEYGGDLRAFMQWMNNGPEEIFGIKTPQEIDAVRVMTIHKAKGLEARVAILPFATLKVRGDGRIYHVDQDHLTVWHTDQGLRNVSQRLSGLYKDKCGKAWLDELNVLYVALTRAKDELYLFLPRKAEGRQKNRLISLLNPLLNGELVAEWGQKVENKSLETSTVDIREQSTGIDFNQHIPGEKAKDINKGWTWPNYLVRRATDFKVLLSPNRKSAAVVGDFVHRLLAKIDSPLRCSSNFEQVFEFLQNIFMSMSRGPDIYAGHGIDLGSIARTICHPLARPLFWTANGCQIWVEKEVADSSGVLFRPDRMVIGQNTLWVGEYKTGMTARTRDKEQLFEYLRLLSQLYPDLGVKGVILYVDQEEVIEVDQIKD